MSPSKIIVDASHNQFIVIIHHIDISDKVTYLKRDGEIEFQQRINGGLVHWTNKVASVFITNGWLKCIGSVYP